MQNLSDQALPDSTTTSFLAHDPQMTLTVTADTCGPEENFAEEFFLAGDQTFLGDDVSAYLGNTDLKRSDQLLAGVDKKDLLSNAIMSMDSTDNNSNNSSVISNDVVSSTIHGFPEAQSEFLTPVLDQQDQFGTPVIVLSAPDQQQQSSPPSSQAPPSSAATATPTVNPSDVYTLTLTDGSVVQLRVQQPDLPQPQMAEEQPQQEVWASQPRSADLNTQLPLVAEEVTLPYTGSMSSSNESVSSYDPDEALDDEALISMFSSVDNVTIETLKAQLTSLPEGQSADLGALLVAAKIDLTVEDIVGPPLAQVKRVMEQKSLADWQVQLCIKIRRRKKNTVSYYFISLSLVCIQKRVWFGCMHLST